MPKYTEVIHRQRVAILRAIQEILKKGRVGYEKQALKMILDKTNLENRGLFSKDIKKAYPQYKQFKQKIKKMQGDL